jgi:hypothetical protein
MMDSPTADEIEAAIAYVTGQAERVRDAMVAIMPTFDPDGDAEQNMEMLYHKIAQPYASSFLLEMMDTYAEYRTLRSDAIRLRRAMQMRDSAHGILNKGSDLLGKPLANERIAHYRRICESSDLFLRGYIAKITMQKRGQ